MSDDEKAFQPEPEPEPQVIYEKPKLSFWRRLGGGSLSVSVIIHVILLCIGAVWVLKIIPPPPEKVVDFMPNGGGGGSPASNHAKARKQLVSQMRPNLARIAVEGAGRIALPDQDESTQLASLGQIGQGGMAGGLGGSGSGGGKGNGHGSGFGDGTGPGKGGGSMGPAPFKMFGNEIKADSIGVVLDVSGSMLPHLAKVIAELDKVAAGSPLILYVGCGIEEGRPRSKSHPTVTIDKQRFERFWRLNHDSPYKPNKTLEEGSADIVVDFTRPLPSELLYKTLAARPNTFYLDFEGTKFAWGALLCKELKDVEAVYWFADFQDKVDEKEAGSVMRRLRSKKQKLYVHKSGGGKYLETIMEQIVKPTDGAVIEVKK